VLFPTIDFAVFFLVAFTGSWILRPYKTLWLWFLLGMSLVFYGWWDWRFTLLIGASILGNWALAQATGRALGPDRARTDRSRWIVRGAVVANLGLLGYFKYADFFATSVASGLDRIGFGTDPPLLDIILPVGISFFTFQALSYVIDVGRGELSPLPLLRVAVFLSFFPQLVAGPIVRASELVPQFDERADPRYVRSAEAFVLIFKGLFKKVVISSFLADQIVDDVFRDPSSYSQLEVLFAIYGYAIQIYADFSGYTDIAIGVALLLGFRFPQNFDAPYIATSLQDFWRRWHLTLSRWLRDYLYIPLGGNRISPGRTYVNLMATMVLGGLWHGANWTFLLWGAIHGGGMAAERWIKEAWAERGRPLGVPAPLRTMLQWLLTFHLVCLAWVFFRAPSVGDAFEMLGRLVGGGAVPVGAASLVTLLVVVVVAASLASQFVPERSMSRLTERVATVPPLVQIAGIAVSVVMIDALGPEGIAPFIYFQF
jgi:D-alanyl-lipoteichoic acid acyltransferase DltB (MBOAT superfamily)